MATLKSEEDAVSYSAAEAPEPQEMRILAQGRMLSGGQKHKDLSLWDSTAESFL